MCGINGIIFKKNDVDISKIKMMNSMLHHRGPDKSGFLKHKNILLGHTRLSIIDLTKNGYQPMSNNGRHWIIYNGEIYNYKEIKKELINKNYKFYSETDTEVILTAFIEWGAKCFEKFNGEWSLAILDTVNNDLIISRDGIGYKPCYIYEDDKYFAFSSELKSFYSINSSLEIDKANFGIASESLFYSSKTIFKNIEHLTQGRFIKYNINSNKKTITRWDFPLNNLPKISVNYKENVENYFSLLHEATKIRLNSDVKIGTSLSGGLDSSAIFSLLNVINSKSKSNDKLDLNPIIMNYKGMRSKNEAIELAKKYNKKFLIIEDQDEKIESTKKILAKLETAEEFFMQYNLYKNQKDRGLKISIDGHGSDEFLGYPNFFPELSVDTHNNLIQLNNAVETFGGQNTNTKFKKLFGIGTNLSKIIDFKTNVNSLNYFSNYIEADPYDSSYQIINDDLENLKYFSYSLNFTYLISYCGWFQFFLNKWDRASMSNSIEVRMPFLDNNVRLFGLALNSEHKIRNSMSKSILRDAFSKHLPKSIIEQKFKQGLSQHRFDINSLKYKEYLKLIIEEKNFKENNTWDVKKIKKDFDQNLNINKIWRLGKYYLMIEGFKDNYNSITINNDQENQLNNLTKL